MGKYSGISEASVSPNRLPYVIPGTYKVQIDRVKDGETRAGVDFFVVEMKILESTNEERPVGTEMSWLVMLNKDAALGNVKSFVAASTGVEIDTIDEDDVMLITSSKNPLNGVEITCRANNIVTKAGNDFTVCTWENAVHDAAAA